MKDYLKNIPIVSSILSVAKIGYNLRERNLCIQLLNFINELNDGCINRKKLQNYQKKLEQNASYAEKELGRIILILDRNIDKEKSVYLARLFKSYINEEISWDKFCEYSEINNRLFISDINLLIDIKMNNLLDTFNRPDKYKYERLNSLGLIALNLTRIGGDFSKPNQDYIIVLTQMGIEFTNKLFNV